MILPDRISPSILPALICAGLCQCASGPELKRLLTVEPGTRTVIAYRAAGSAVYSAINLSALKPEEIDQVRRADPSLKVIPDEQVQLVLDRFGALRFFDIATSTPHPEATFWLIVRHGHDDYVVSNRATDPEDLASFAACLSDFTSIHSANKNYTSSDMTARDFQRLGETTNQESQAIRAGKEGKNRYP